MRFAIRDDDTGFFTDPETLEKLYGPLLRFVPVSLAVVPFAVQSFHLGDAARFYQAGDPRALAGNEALVQWLRARLDSAQVSVMCHGYSHEYGRGGWRGRLVPEYVWKPGRRMAEETAQGRLHLESVLGVPVTTFVPPGNSISRAGLEAVGASLPNVVATVPLRRLRDLRPEWDALASYARRLYHHAVHGIANPRMERLAGVRMLPSFSLVRGTSWEQIARRFELCWRLGTDFIVAVHYWELDARLCGMLRRLIERAAGSGCRFVHCDELFSSPCGLEIDSCRENRWAGSRIS